MPGNTSNNSGPQSTAQLDLITKEHPDYDQLRQVWNATADRYPSAIARCRRSEDVSNAVLQAAATGLPVSVRGGGHNIAGTAVADDALMIDLTEMHAVEIDVSSKKARVQGGATWANLDTATQAHGLVTPGGVVSETGVGGLTLGGGIGWLARRFGLTIDNLLSAEIVLADGRIITASKEKHADLFWAIRGGSGNFGVVTSFTFQLHHLSDQALFGPTFFALEDAARVLNAYATHAPNLPREACVWANIMTAPALPILPESHHGDKVLNLMQCHTGDPQNARTDLVKLYGGATPLGSALEARPFIEAQSFLDPVYEFGARNYWRAHNHQHLGPALIDLLVELAPSLPTPESEILICQLGGAVADVPDTETAFPHRKTQFLSTPGVRWRNPGDDVQVIGWLKDASSRIAKHATPGGYVNFITETADTSARAYGQNLERLSRIKRRYDPNNLFRVNQNIVPAPISDTQRDAAPGI
ncbi:FAD-binding oxidoreductase [uncultured Roseobacter sp.]|uniref:FAD-binding oxidoreductase n=1 Tax=uncultured Roseobacter sp. TaxID=114847 RepID=UPI002629C0A2|nr:FAD-binding oxidoreductase [uncultured Roseobacter sp.]